jgi:hypothetical protein
VHCIFSNARVMGPPQNGQTNCAIAPLMRSTETTTRRMASAAMPSGRTYGLVTFTYRAMSSAVANHTPGFDFM